MLLLVDSFSLMVLSSFDGDDYGYSLSPGDRCFDTRVLTIDSLMMFRHVASPSSSFHFLFMVSVAYGTFRPLHLLPSGMSYNALR